MHYSHLCAIFTILPRNADRIVKALRYSEIILMILNLSFIENNGPDVVITSETSENTAAVDSDGNEQSQ